MALLRKKGGAIKIKKKNIGAFTKTKQQTGKSASELAHSKNPKTRKRAQFELNAKTWKHKCGGLLKKKKKQEGGTMQRQSFDTK